MKGKYKGIPYVSINTDTLERYYLYRTPEQLKMLIGGILGGLGLIDIDSNIGGEPQTDIENVLATSLPFAETWYRRSNHMRQYNNGKDKAGKEQSNKKENLSDADKEFKDVKYKNKYDR